MPFLIAIFASFILYGLTSSLFSSVWPEIAGELNVDFALLGVLTMIISAASGISSAFAYKIRRKLGTSISTTISLFGFIIGLVLLFLAQNLIMICIALAIIGSSNGIIDTIVNSYMIKAYGGGKISMLHASWGLGSAVGPMIMSYAIVSTHSYRNGFIWVISIILITSICFILLKIYWEGKKKALSEDFVNRHSVSKEEKESHINLKDIFTIKLGFIFVICFILCGATNTTISNWIATLSVKQRNITVAEGATAAAFYFGGLTAVRIILGFISDRIKTKYIMFFGLIVSIIGYALMFLPNKSLPFTYFIATIVGVGISPLVPFLHHSVKELFDEKYIGVIVSCCNTFSLIGGATATALMSLMIKLVGVNNAQLLLLAIVVIALIIYNHIIKVKEKEGA